MNRAIFIVATAFVTAMVAYCFITIAWRDGTKGEAVAQTSPSFNTVKQVRILLKRAKRELTKAGKYECCIEPGCDFCVLTLGECPCAETLKKQGIACPECTGGWRVGHGSVHGVEPSQVKMWTEDRLKKAYGARAK